MNMGGLLIRIAKKARRLTSVRIVVDKYYSTRLLWVRAFSDLSLGSEGWLIEREAFYGGRVEDLSVNTHQRRANKLAHIGGDRMLHHGYGKHYSRHLARFLTCRESLSIVEIGILKGSGLAIWCEMFPSAAVFGLDIDLSYFHANVDFLKDRGGFRHSMPKLLEFDQFEDNRHLVRTRIGTDINVCIDDGHHSHEAILSTFRSMRPNLARGFVYFIEDNDSVADVIQSHYSDLVVHRYGALTVLEERLGSGPNAH